MKILYFLDFPYNIGGSNKVLIIQAHIMQQKGCEVLVVVPDDENGCHSEAYGVLLRQYNLNYISAQYTIATHMFEINILDVIRRFDSIAEIIKGFSPDIIHSTQINVVVELVSRSLHIPHLMNVYPVAKDSFDFDWLDVYPHYHSADSLLFSNRWKAGLKIESQCIRVAYDINKFIDNRKATGVGLHFFHVGVFSKIKNQMEVIRLIQHCRNESIDVIMTFLGDYTNDYGEQCRKYVNDNSLEEYIIFEGFVNNVEDFFADADLLIVASTVESYPGVIVEGMANRVPVLSTPVAGVPELLIDEYNGFLAKGYKEEDLWSALQRYLNFKENDRISDIIDHACQTVDENHSYQVVGDNLETYYQWIVEHNKTTDAEQIGIKEIRKVFGGYLDKFLNTMEAERYVWSLYHIIQRIGSKKVVIWGTGKMGTSVLTCLELMGYAGRVIGFADTYKQGQHMGYPILSDRDRIEDSEYVLLVAIGDFDAKKGIKNKLESYGMKKHKDYYFVRYGIADI